MIVTNYSVMQEGSIIGMTKIFLLKYIYFTQLGPEPAFGRLGLVNRWEGTVLRDTLLTPRFAPTLRAGAQLGGLASH